ncbi:MAG: hypothetical protein MJE68_07345, partial [Proteobacteria bacterium]|nr:hypothetical protein [Pseudomonadota bacterium]
MANNNGTTKKQYNREEALLILMGGDDYSCSGESSSEDSEECQDDENTVENTSSDSFNEQHDFIIPPSPKKVKIAKKNNQRIKRNESGIDKHDKDRSTSTCTTSTYCRPTFQYAASFQSNTPHTDKVTTTDAKHLCDHDKPQTDSTNLPVHGPVPSINTPPPENEPIISIQLDVEPEQEDISSIIDSTTDPLDAQIPQQYDNIDDSEPEEANHYYVIEEEEVNPSEDITEIPIVNYPRDKIFPEDEENGWKKIENDDVPDYGPFLGHQGINLDTESRNPEDFFNNLFSPRMFTIIAEATNNYARK